MSKLSRKRKRRLSRGELRLVTADGRPRYVSGLRGDEKRRPREQCPKPQPGVTVILKMNGLDPKRVYALRRWDKQSVDLERLSCALFELAGMGWKIDVLAAVFDRHPTVIENHINNFAAHRRRRFTDPIYDLSLQTDDDGAPLMTTQEIAAIRMFSDCYRQYKAVIGAPTTDRPPGSGQPLSDARRAKIEERFRMMEAQIKIGAGDRALSAIKDIVNLQAWYKPQRLKLAARCIDPSITELVA